MIDDIIRRAPMKRQRFDRWNDCHRRNMTSVCGPKCETFSFNSFTNQTGTRRRSKVLAPEKPKPTFREIANLGIVYANQNHASPSKMVSILSFLCNDFGDRIAETISKTELENWLNNKAENRDWSDKKWSAKTKRNYRTAIRISYKEGMRLGIIEVDPTAQIIYRREPQREVRDITPEEMDRIRASIAIPGSATRTPAFCRDCLAQFEVAHQTGMRKSEQFRATWEKIDWKRSVLFIPKSKNGDPRDVYLNSYVIAILRAVQVEQTCDGILPTGRIFRIKDPRGWFENTLKYAQIHGVTWHCLRHSFATHLVQVNVPMKYVQDLMGHIDWESTARYIHPADNEVMAGIATISDDSVPEYLLNKSYILALLEDDADSPVMPMPEFRSLEAESGQMFPVEASVNESELPPRMLTRIPREELYELVWSEPVMHVARRLGRSGVAVAHACRKRDIPVPGRGYWN
ncbi:MAG: site-specific integrase [Terracidiphilus sp.]|jgi:site-specific recombinase XerD